MGFYFSNFVLCFFSKRILVFDTLGIKDSRMVMCLSLMVTNKGELLSLLKKFKICKLLIKKVQGILKCQTLIVKAT